MLLIAVVGLGPLLEYSTAGISRFTPAQVKITRNVTIPMRDGIRLHGVLYLPQGVDRQHAAIVTLTPYGSDSCHEYGIFFAERGFAFLAVDVRGRGESQGRFELFVNEGKDGHDVVEWVARQPWCNGKVAMWGDSYSAYVQWATAKQHPPHLQTIVPVSAAHPGVDVPAWGGIADAYFLRWHCLVYGRTPATNLFKDDRFWIGVFRKRFVEHIPYRQMDELAGGKYEAFRLWLDRREDRDYWQALVPSKEDYRKMQMPVLTVTGYYDGDQLGAIEYYSRHRRHGRPEVFKRHYLVLGPWDHQGIRAWKSAIGALRFDKRSDVKLHEIEAEWYRWALEDGVRPMFLQRRVMYFLAGLGTWKPADSTAVFHTKRTRLYLASHGRANDIFHSGSLQPDVPATSVPDSYRYNPLDVRFAEMEKAPSASPLTDQRYALNLRDAGVIYHSRPFERDVEVAGRFRLTLYAKLDVPDTDFLIHIYAILPDGKSILLTQDRLRARYRTSLFAPKLPQPGKIERYVFDRFPITARLLPKGSRLRLLIRAPNSIFFERNYNSGGRVERETAKDARTATVTIYHDADYRSCLEVPGDL